METRIATSSMTSSKDSVRSQTTYHIVKPHDVTTVVRRELQALACAHPFADAWIHCTETFASKFSPLVSKMAQANSVRFSGDDTAIEFEVMDDKSRAFTKKITHLLNELGHDIVQFQTFRARTLMGNAMKCFSLF